MPTRAASPGTPTASEDPPRGITRLLNGLTLVLALITVTLAVATWARHAGAPEQPGATVVCVLLAALAVWLAAAIRLSAPKKAAVLAGALSCVILLLAFEVTLAFLQWSARRAVSDSGVDVRTKLQVVEDLRRAGTDAVPSISPIQVGELPAAGGSIYPLAGISNATTVMCLEGSAYAIYRSDERGFNNPSGIWSLPTIDVVALGDSFIHGWCVPEDSNLVAGIRRTFPATLNLGMAGNGPLANAAVFREYVEPLRPKVVLWFYFENDLSELEIEKERPFLRRYLEAGFRQNLVARQGIIDGALRDLVETRASAAPVAAPGGAAGVSGRGVGARMRDVLSFAKTSALIARGIVPRRPKAGPCCDLELFRQLLASAQATTRSWGGELVFVFLPARERYQREPLFRTSADELAARAALFSMVESLGIPIIDVHTAFDATRTPLELFPDPLAHYNAKGYAVAAEFIAQRLARRGNTAPAP